MVVISQPEDTAVFKNTPMCPVRKIEPPHSSKLWSGTNKVEASFVSISVTFCRCIMLLMHCFWLKTAPELPNCVHMDVKKKIVPIFLIQILSHQLLSLFISHKNTKGHNRKHHRYRISSAVKQTYVNSIGLLYAKWAEVASYREI